MNGPKLQHGRWTPLASLLGRRLPQVVVLDIGAMPEGNPRYNLLADQPDTKVIAIEPVETSDVQLPVWLGDGEIHQVYHARYQGCTSIFQPNSDVINRYTGIDATSPGGNFTTVKVDNVKTTKLDQIQLSDLPDYIKIDTQGSELMILRHGVNALSAACVVEIEVEFVELYLGQPLAFEVMEFMHRNGFELHRFLDMAGRGIRPWLHAQGAHQSISQLLWADAVFIRRNLQTSDQKMKVARILHDVYCSYDLASSLLDEPDRKKYIQQLLAEPLMELQPFVTTKKTL